MDGFFSLSHVKCSRVTKLLTALRIVPSSLPVFRLSSFIDGFRLNLLML